MERWGNAVVTAVGKGKGHLLPDGITRTCVHMHTTRKHRGGMGLQRALQSGDGEPEPERGWGWGVGRSKPLLLRSLLV